MEHVLRTGAAELGLHISSATVGSFEQYAALLDKEKQNLTAVKGEDIVHRHFLDSLALFTVADFSGKSLIDIGSGAGFPGVPLSLVIPDIRLTLLDSMNKRIEFLRRLCAALEVKADFICQRAEEASKLSVYRERYDFAVSRAVARLNVLCELCMPFVIPGGCFLAMKSADAAEELSEAGNAIETLGGVLEAFRIYECGGVKRGIAIIRKVTKIPELYPRRFSRIQKTPL